MQKFKTFLSVTWFLCISLISPVWIGCIYMYITGHGKGYAYDMGSEADISILIGVILLLLWLSAAVPVTVHLCGVCRRKRRPPAWVPILAFLLLFAVGVCVIGWNEFIRLFGYGYPA